MKLSKKLIPLLLVVSLAYSMTACGQIENGTTSSEEINSSQPESSISQTSEESSSLPEEIGSAPESSQTDKSSTASDSTENPNSGSSSYTLEQERGISDFTMITVTLLDYVGVENSESWAKTAYEQGKARNIKTFIDHFQIDYDTFWGIFEDDFNTHPEEMNNLGYQSIEEYIHSYYTNEQLNALFYGDEAKIRKAFHLPDDYPVF